MPTQLLTQSFVKRNNLCPSGKKKVDFFDTKVPGLLLKVLDSGRKTWYVRYSNAHARIKEKKLANAAIMELGEARELARRNLSDIALGNDPFDAIATMKQIPTLSEFLNETYLPYIKSHKRSWETDLILIRVHVLPKWGSLHLDEISHRHAIGLISEHRMTHKPASTNRLYDTLNTLFHLAIRWETGLKANPLKNVKRYQTNNMRDRYLTEEEAKKLFQSLESSQSPQLKHIVAMLLLTGARLSEVLNSKWKDYDSEAKVWKIEVNKSGKTRFVPLSDGAIHLLESMPRDDNCPYPFANPKTGKPYTSIFYTWDTARQRAGLPDLRIHDLRHSFASFLINRGRSIYEVQKILGHTQIRTTQRYAHLSQETLLEAANTAMTGLPSLAAKQLEPVSPARLRPERPQRTLAISHSQPPDDSPRDSPGQT